MNAIQRMAKNTGVQVVSQFTTLILGFLYTMYSARYLGTEGFGILTFALALTALFGVFADMGLHDRWSDKRDSKRLKGLSGKYLGNIAGMKAILAVIAFGLIFFTMKLLGYPEQTTKVVYLIALSTIFNSYSGIFYSIFQAHEKMEYKSLGQILSSALMLLGALFAISQSFSVVEFSSIYFITSAIILGYSFAVCAFLFVLPKIEVDLGFWMSLIKEALPFGFSGFFVAIYYWVASVMLYMMKGNEVVGWYNAAYRIIVVLVLIPAIFQNAIYPVTSRCFTTSNKSLKFASERFLNYMIIIGIPIGIGTTLLANKIILLIFRCRVCSFSDRIAGFDLGISICFYRVPI